MSQFEFRLPTPTGHPDCSLVAPEAVILIDAREAIRPARILAFELLNRNVTDLVRPNV